MDRGILGQLEVGLRWSTLSGMVIFGRGEIRRTGREVYYDIGEGTQHPDTNLIPVWAGDTVSWGKVTVA